MDTLIQLVPETAIARMREKRAEALARSVDASGFAPYQPTVETCKNRQAEFLASFERCLSPSVACKVAKVPLATYRKWRQTDPEFAEALNQVLLSVRDELITSSMARAIGYSKFDEATGLPQVDAEGRVVRSGASDVLAKHFLQVEQGPAAAASRVQVNFQMVVGGTPELTVDVVVPDQDD